MGLSELEAAVLRDRYGGHAICTPEELATSLGVTLGEIREAEKTALRKLDNPGNVDTAGLADLDLTRLEAAVIRARYCVQPARTPEQLAEACGVTLGEIFEAEKSAMSKIQDPAHANAESLGALGMEP